MRALALAANGDVVAGGVFPTAGGSPASNIARWNGSAWCANSVLTAPWTGFEWLPLGPGLNDAVHASRRSATATSSPPAP